MNHVYIAYCGEYVDRLVSGVFTTEEAALAYAKKQAGGHEPINEIERWETDNPDADTQDIPLPQSGQ